MVLPLARSCKKVRLPCRKLATQTVQNKQAKKTSRGARAGIGISNILFLLVGMGLMALTGVLKPAFGPRTASAPALDNPKAPPAPWGELEYSRFALTQPEEYLPDSTNQMPAASWYFEKTAPAQVMELFRSVEATPAVREFLLDSNRWQVAGDGVVVSPTFEILLGLGRPARERIYSVLGRSPMNLPQYYPFRFRADGFEEWFARSRLAPDKLQLVRSLIYTNRGGSICLADLDVLQQKFAPDDFRDVFESLYSEQSLFLSLRLKPDADVNQLAQYWGRGGREQEVLTILKSIAKSPGGGSINVAYLLPSFARLRLYTFAPATNDSVITGQDCFWTVLNFFTRESDLRTATESSSVDTLIRDYRETHEPPAFGDLVLFLENRKPVHACVYIADNVVFTKNGVNYHQPWVLMKMSDLLPRYATDRPMSLVVVRRRQPEFSAVRPSQAGF